MSDLRTKLAERVAELEQKIQTLGAEINSESEALQNKKLEVEKANKELAILLKTAQDLKKEGI